MNKLKVGFIGNNPLSKTGLARNLRAFLPILYYQNKWDIYFLNQGMGDGAAAYQKLPWKNEGCMKNFDQNRFNSDTNYQRYIAYCNGAIEDWIVRNKLDAVIGMDDAWFIDLAHLKSDWYNHIKDNFLFNITIDSEPIISSAKEIAKNCPNFCVWSGFAERLLKQEDSRLYGHVKTLRGAIDIEQFKPIPKKERLDLRHKFNITDDEKIIMYLGRNQLRKNSFHGNQEALALWKQKYPEKKIRLLFHTKFSEPNGWPIDQIRQELKLNKEDILCTYFCRNCNDWNLQSFDGEDLDCPICKAQKSRVTPGVDSTINEHELNKIYNIADACCSSFTSGGQEYNLVESMLSGLPLACPDYSSGEDFILSGLVKEIKGNYYREFNTSFYKFTPDANSILEFYEYVWNLKENDREKLVKDAREWAIKEFDGNVIAKQIESFLDNCKPINWDTFLAKKKEIKPINSPVQDHPDDITFIKNAYKTLLNMDVKDDDSGLIHWTNFLKQPKDKNQLKNELVSAFKNAGHQHNQKVQPQIPFESLLDPTDKERCLLILKESFGDHLILTSLIPEIQLKYPNSRIYISCDEKYFDIYDNFPYNIKLLKWSQEQEQEMLMCGVGGNKKYFDYLHNIGLTTQRNLNYLNSKYE